MDTRRPGVGWTIAALLCWLLILLLMLVVIPVGMFVVPSMVESWKAQGVKELPTFWQIVVDLSDITRFRWYLVFPLLLAGALFSTARAAQARRQGG